MLFSVVSLLAVLANSPRAYVVAEIVPKELTQVSEEQLLGASVQAESMAALALLDDCVIGWTKQGSCLSPVRLSWEKQSGVKPFIVPKHDWLDPAA
jgi:hypothetical protein